MVSLRGWLSIAIIGICLLLVPVTAQAYTYTIWFGTESTTTNFSSPLGSFYAVTSAYNQPRLDGSNPHQGTDLAATELAVYPVANGTYGGSYTDADGMLYAWVIHSTVGITSHYLHLKSVGSWTVGQSITTADQIGISGKSGLPGTPYHLDFRLKKTVTYPAPEGSKVVCVSPAPHYTWAYSWSYGRDLAFIKETHIDSERYVRTVVYSVDDVYGYSAPKEVKIFCRKNGSTTWSGPFDMTDVAGVYEFDLASLDPTAFPTGYVNVLIRASRLDRQPTYNYAWDAPKYNQPTPLPNSTTYKYNYYNFYLRR